MIGELVNQEDIDAPQINTLHDPVQLPLTRVAGANAVLGHFAALVVVLVCVRVHAQILVVEVVRPQVRFD